MKRARPSPSAARNTPTTTAISRSRTCPPLLVDRKWVEDIKAKLPELPEARRDRFVAQYGLPLYDANLFTGPKPWPTTLKTVVGAQAAARQRCEQLASRPGERHHEPAQCRYSRIPQVRWELTGSAQLLGTGRRGSITAATARIVLEEMFTTSKTADVIVKEKGLGQISDSPAIEGADARR